MRAVLILMATYNGEEYLSQQLDSIFAQNYKDIFVAVVDDSSTDSTFTILNQYQKKHSKRFIHLEKSSENRGHLKTFSRLLSVARKQNFHYFMLADQDDVWERDKVQITMDAMAGWERFGKAIPTMVHTDLKVVDSNLKLLSDSFVRSENLYPVEELGLERLLVQNVVTGCTVGFNRILLQYALPIPEEAVIHDWWLALIAKSCGRLIYLDRTTLLYRQHGNNAVGASGTHKRINSLLLSIFGEKSTGIVLQARALEARLVGLGVSNLNKTLVAFNQGLRTQSKIERARQLRKAKFFRNNFFETVCLYVLLLVRK